MELSDLEENGEIQEIDMNFREGNGFSSHARFAFEMEDFLSMSVS